MTDPIEKPTDDAAPAAPIPVMEKLGLKPEDMFPETPGGPDVSTLVNQFAHDEPDDGPRPQWLFRVTQELTPSDVLRLFQAAPHLVTRRVLAAIDTLYGETAVRLMEAPIPGVDQKYRHPRRGLLRHLCERAASRLLDMVPRGELSFERGQFTAQLRYREARAALQGATDMAGDLRDKVVAIERAIFPGMKAQTREGKTWRGERAVAVWAGIDEETGQPTEPPKEPEF